MKEDLGRVSLTELIGSGTGAVKNIDWHGKLTDDEDVKFPEDLKISVKLINTGEEILGEIGISGNVELECDRCLKKFLAPIKLSTNETFSKDSDDEATKINDDTIDFRKIVRETILLKIPMKKLCKVNCEGRPHESYGDQGVKNG